MGEANANDRIVNDCRLFETHLPVRDLERSQRFYESVLELQLGHVDAERRIALYWIGGWGTTMLGLWETPAEKMHHEHFAIEVPLDRLNAAILQLHAKGVETKNFFGEVTATPTVLGWMPAVSIYFDDPDGHLLEFISMMPGEPRPDLGIFPWEEQFAQGL